MPVYFTTDEATKCGEPIFSLYNQTCKYPTTSEINALFETLSISNINETCRYDTSIAKQGEISKLAWKFGPFYVHRTKKELLKNILIEAGGDLLSYEKAKAEVLIKEPPFTPDSEEVLYGAKDCVFASAGPAYGMERYGEVIIKIDEKFIEENAWATISSGWFFLKSRHPEKNAGFSKFISGDDDIMAYSLAIFTGDNLKAYMLCYLI